MHGLGFVGFMFCIVQVCFWSRVSGLYEHKALSEAHWAPYAEPLP